MEILHRSLCGTASGVYHDRIPYPAQNILFNYLFVYLLTLIVFCLFVCLFVCLIVCLIDWLIVRLFAVCFLFVCLFYYELNTLFALSPPPPPPPNTLLQESIPGRQVILNHFTTPLHVYRIFKPQVLSITSSCCCVSMKQPPPPPPPHTHTLLNALNRSNSILFFFVLFIWHFKLQKHSGMLKWHGRFSLRLLFPLPPPFVFKLNKCVPLLLLAHNSIKSVCVIHKLILLKDWWTVYERVRWKNR